MFTPNDLRAKAQGLSDTAQAIVAKANAENRDPTADELKSIQTITAQVKDTLAQAELAETMAAQNASLAQPLPRKAAPVDTRSPITAADDRGNWGFKNEGEFLRSVMNASRGYMDPRLVKNAVATYGSEGTPADGGFAVPPDFRAGVQTLLDSPDNIFSRLDQLTTPNAAITVPINEDPYWSSNGLAAGVVAEGAALTPKKPALKQLVLTLQKYGDLAFVTNEMLADGTNIGPFIQKAAADKIQYQLNAAVYTAITGSGSKITASKGSTGTGLPATVANILTMWTSVPASWQKRAVWMMNQSYQAVLPTFNSSTTGAGWPIFMPAGGLSAQQYETLMGRPIIWFEGAAASGTEGDIVLFVPDQFYGVTKTEGLRVDYSKDFAFDQDLVGFRFYERAVAKSKLSAPITMPDTTTRSNAVTLATR